MTMHEGYLHRVLADGVRRFSYRSGVGRLLGQPDAMYAVDFAPDLTPGFAFPHPVWKSDAVYRLRGRAFGPVPFEPVPFHPGPLEPAPGSVQPARQKPGSMDPAESDASRPPVDEGTRTLPAETYERWMAGLSGGQPLDNGRQPRPESRTGGGGTPEHARKESRMKPLIDNKSGRSALKIPGYTAQRTSRAVAAAAGFSGPHPDSPSAPPAGAFGDGVRPAGAFDDGMLPAGALDDGMLPAGALDDVGPGWRPAVLPGQHPAPGGEQLESNFPSEPASGAGGGFMLSPMMAPKDVPRGFEPLGPYVLWAAESAAVGPAAALHRAPVGHESDFTSAEARFLPDRMIGNQSAGRAEVDLSAAPVGRDGALAELSQRTANAVRGSSGRPVRGVPRPGLSYVGPAEAQASYGDDQDPTALPPRQHVPQVLEVPATGEESRSGSPAFWERRHLRRWQTGLLR
jgi:hypothetical protein